MLSFKENEQVSQSGAHGCECLVRAFLSANPWRRVDRSHIICPQKADWFLKINPNGRIPAIRHHGAGPDGTDIDVFESGAILEYLVEAFPESKTSLLPKAEPARSLTRGWLHW